MFHVFYDKARERRRIFTNYFVEREDLVHLGSFLSARLASQFYLDREPVEESKFSTVILESDSLVQPIVTIRATKAEGKFFIEKDQKSPDNETSRVIAIRGYDFKKPNSATKTLAWAERMVKRLNGGTV